MDYYHESFSEQERALLSRFFTNLDGPVFALVNLPEVVKGALFARYSRTHKSLRRLFLDEFMTQSDLGIKAIAAELSSVDPYVNLKRAENLYKRVFDQFGDDSVAQLGGAHLACEQASNLLTKVLEWGRLAAYLEQSTRYIPYHQLLGKRYRFLLPPEIQESPLQEEYEEFMTQLFDTYRELFSKMKEHFYKRHPRRSGEKASVYERTIEAKSFDTIRGLLPASTVSNVGIYASGQAYEMALIRMQSHPLQEVRDYGAMMLTELRKVIPSFLTRVDRPDRGVLWSRYLSDTTSRLEEMAERLGLQPVEGAEVTLTDWDPDAERKLAAAALYGVTEMSDTQLQETVDRLPPSEIAALIATLVGKRRNRRHKPGRAMERSYYRFDVMCDFGAFRDLQRHRMMTIEWQPLTARLGYERPDALSEAGHIKRWDNIMDKAGEFYEDIRASLGRQVAQYAVPFAYRIRFMMEMNARQAMHLIELRTQPAGHPNYRRVCIEMHRQIAEVAGHTGIADAFTFLNTQGEDLERLVSERRAARRATQRMRQAPLPLLTDDQLPLSPEG